jgi:RimJ/RimL family protein N-acetyltransferase
VRCLLEYLFGELHLHRVIATCDVENIASFRLLERIGMRREAHLVENIWFKGAWGSEYSYALLYREWSRGHNSAESK